MPWLAPRIAAVFLAVIAADPLFASLSPESGSFYFQNYSPKTYGANPQNWAIVQDARGLMYFGNTDGVLEFDGVFWRLIRLPHRSGVRSLALDANGRIYVGGRGEFGYLKPDAHGNTTFIPIAVPKEEADFFDVWNIVPTSAGVYFGTDFKIFFRSNSGQIKTFKATKQFGRIFAAYGELYAATVDKGLRRLQGDDFVAGPRGDSAGLGPRLFFAPGEHPILAGREALFNFTLSDITPFMNGASDYIHEKQVLSIKQLSTGDVAVGTKSGGLVFLNRQGELERVVRKENGLIFDQITAIYEDSAHRVWIATDNGIGRFPLDLSVFGESHGLDGSAISETRFENSMYIGTTRGAFRMHVEQGIEPTFAAIQGLNERVWVFAAAGDDLLAGGDLGLYRIANNSAIKLLKSDKIVVYDIGLSRRDSNVLYTAGVGGVRRWRRLGKVWTADEPVGVKGQEFRTVVEDVDGTVWSTTDVSIWHMNFSEAEPKFHQYISADGIPTGWKNAYSFRGHVVFATLKGLLRFSGRTGKFVPDEELGSEYSDGSKGVSLVREDSGGNVWITGEGYHHVLEKTPDGFRTFASPFVHIGADELYSFALDQDGTCWASVASGALFRLEKLDFKQQRQPLPVLFRRISVIGQKDSLFGGDSEPTTLLVLQHRDNALRFEFDAPFFDEPAALEYQFQLDSSEKKWSNWTTEGHKDYTNLFEGTYRFHVRVRDPHGTVGGDAVFPFQVTPPVYRTWWAYVAYVSCFLLAGWLILRWRFDALQAKNRWLEGVVELRTAEVRKERDQNEALLLNILPRPVAAELRSNGNVKPTTFDDATVCFSDFVGFTLSSEKLPAETLINALNEYFTAFDDIVGRYGLEKLKTIGDAYMFAGGLPNLRPSHAVDAVLAALEMAAVVNRLTQPEQGVNWQIRLGLYSGPVVSGVVGVRKFAFDIWGNTVNFAARMESAGQPGRVNLSETTFQRVEQFIECEPRGPVRIKEGREMEMFFAIGPRTELLQGEVVDGIPEAFRIAYEKAFGEAPRSFPIAAVLEDCLQARLTVAPSDKK